MTAASDADFLVGRDLAVAMLRTGSAGWGGQDACATAFTSIEAIYRDGRDQQNWVLQFVRAVIARPDLAEGFAAVLSDGLHGGFADPDVYDRLSIRDMRGAKHDAVLQKVLSASAASVDTTTTG